MNMSVLPLRSMRRGVNFSFLLEKNAFRFVRVCTLVGEYTVLSFCPSPGGKPYRACTLVWEYTYLRCPERGSRKKTGPHLRQHIRMTPLYKNGGDTRTAGGRV